MNKELKPVAQMQTCKSNIISFAQKYAYCSGAAVMVFGRDMKKVGLVFVWEKKKNLNHEPQEHPGVACQVFCLRRCDCSSV